MSDCRHLLIALRLTLGIVLLGLAVACGWALWVHRKEDAAFIAGLAVACLATFGTGIYFSDRALDLSLWTPLYPSRTEFHDESEE